MPFFSRSITNHLSLIDCYIHETYTTEEHASSCSETISHLTDAIHRFNLDDKLTLLGKLADIKSRVISQEAPRKRRRLNHKCTQVALISLKNLNNKISKLENLIIDELWESLRSAAINENKEKVLDILNRNLPSEIVQRIFFPNAPSISFFLLAEIFIWPDIADKLFSLFPVYSPYLLTNFNLRFDSYYPISHSV